jgi:hypothetical protein
MKQAASRILVAPCSAYSSVLKMEAICFSERPVDLQRNTRLYIAEDRVLHFLFLFTGVHSEVKIDYNE